METRGEDFDTLYQQYYTIQLCHTLAIQETFFIPLQNAYKHDILPPSSFIQFTKMFIVPTSVSYVETVAIFIKLSNCSVGQYFSCIMYSVASEEKGGLGGKREEEKGGLGGEREEEKGRRRKGDWREKGRRRNKNMVREGTWVQ